MMPVCVPASWFLLFLYWFGYTFTYPQDAAKLRREMVARQQMLEGR